MKHYLAGILVLLVLAVVVGIVRWHADLLAPQQESTSAPDLAGRLIQLGPPHRRDFSLRCPWFGKTESKERLSIIALESGRIGSVAAPDETSVEKGAVLFTLSGPVVENRLRALRTRIAALQSRVTLAEQTLALLQQSVAQKMARKQDLLSARDSLARLRSDLTQARQELTAFQGRLQVHAPVSGVFTARRANLGQDVAKGQILAQIIPPRSVRIVATLFPPPGVSLVGRDALVSVGDDQTMAAPVTKVLPRQTSEGATAVWIEGDQLDRRLAPGRTLAGQIIVAVHHDALALPLSAVIRDQQERPFVFVKTSQGYRQQSVQTGLVLDGWVEIKAGLKPTDNVVLRGAYELFYRNFNQTYQVRD